MCKIWADVLKIGIMRGRGGETKEPQVPCGS